MRTRAYPPILHALAADAYSPTLHAERLGERSPGPCSSLSATFTIGITPSSAIGLVRLGGLQGTHGG